MSTPVLLCVAECIMHFYFYPASFTVSVNDTICCLYFIFESFNPL